MLMEQVQLNQIRLSSGNFKIQSGEYFNFSGSSKAVSWGVPLRLFSAECKGSGDPSEGADGGEKEELSQLCPWALGEQLEPFSLCAEQSLAVFCQPRVMDLNALRAVIRRSKFRWKETSRLLYFCAFSILSCIKGKTSIFFEEAVSKSDTWEKEEARLSLLY